MKVWVVMDDTPQLINDKSDLIIAYFDAPVLFINLLKLLVRVGIDGSTSNVNHHAHRNLEG